MENIIPPVSKDKLLKELTGEKFIRRTNNAGNQLFIITEQDSPNIMREIGRLRELTFRAAGGGTGKAVDIDDYDTGVKSLTSSLLYGIRQNRRFWADTAFIFVMKPIAAMEDEIKLATAKLFHFSKKFREEFLPFTIELGSSFVQPKYQTTNRMSKALYALDNLWDGLGTLVIDYPEKKYFFGKVTMYKNYNQRARNLILYFLEKHFPDNEDLVTPIVPLETNINR